MHLKHLILALSISLFIACTGKKEHTEHARDTANSNTDVQPDTIKKSIPKEEHAQIGSAHAMIHYHAPAVRGRTIWGGLVPYGEVWVTGAHSATAFEIDKPIIVDGKEVPAGKYALFTIPEKEKWTIIINKNWDQHLADEYDQKDDVVRLQVQPQPLEHTQERLRYAIVSSSENESAIDIRWEKIKVSLPFKIK
jgi:hypothetical protein